MNAQEGILCLAVTPDQRLREDLTAEDAVELAHSGAATVWLHVNSSRAANWPQLAEQSGFHPLAIEDTLSPDCRVKLEEYEGCLFVVVRDVYFATDTPDPYDFASTNLYLFLGPNYLVTVHAGESRPAATLASRMRLGPELFHRGADHLAYMLIDNVVDLYFPFLDEIDLLVDQIESAIYEQDGATDTVEQIFDLKRTLLALRRHEAPLREVTATLANRPTQYIRPETQLYFRDVYDHVVRQLESVETYRDLLSGAMDLHFSVISNRMNEVIKALSVIATLVLPPTFVASIYGMNFDWMPFLHSPGGFWYALALMFGVSAALMWYLKKKRWI